MLTRIWSMLRSVTTRQAVGTDKAGNLYYRIASRDGPERRWVEYKDKSSADPTTLPVEWTSWLHGTRRDPPTAEEIIELEQKRKLVKFKAFLLQKEEEKRKFRAKSLQSGLTSDDVNPETMELYLQKVATADSAGPPEAGEKDSEQANDVAEGTGPLRSPLDSGPFQPESWQPGVWQPDSSKQKVANLPPLHLPEKQVRDTRWISPAGRGKMWHPA